MKVECFVKGGIEGGIGFIGEVMEEYGEFFVLFDKYLNF